MKEMSNRELMDAVDSAMKTVAERFRLLREAEASEQKAVPLPSQNTKSAA